MADEAEVEVPIRADGLQITESRDFQRRFWMAERIGWLGFALIIVLAIAGFGGRGGWFAVVVTEATDLRAELPRVARRGESAVVLLTLSGKPGEHGVTIGGDLLAHYELEGVTPLPVRSAATREGLALVLRAEGDAPREMQFNLRARRAGFTQMVIVVDGVALSARGLVLP